MSRSQIQNISDDLKKWKEYNCYHIIHRLTNFIKFKEKDIIIVLNIVDIFDNRHLLNKKQLQKIVSDYDANKYLFEEKHIWFNIITIIHNKNLIPIVNSTEYVVDIERLINYLLGYEIKKEPLIHSYGRRVSKRFPLWSKNCSECRRVADYYGRYDGPCMHENYWCTVIKNNKTISQYKYKKSDMPKILSATCDWIDNEMKFGDFEGLLKDIDNEVGKYVCNDIKSIIMEYI